MDKIVEELVDAGYFRARIRTLSDFDKIIGGIAWTMQFFSVDINIDIFYNDALDLGQKIALTERLVMVMLVMNCPHPIEPHQIVGLDYTNLLPTIRWLIKKSAEIRKEHEAFNRLMALRHFHRVTKTTPDRSAWCKLINIESLRNVHSTKGAGLYLNKDSADFEVEKHQENRLVSLVKLPSLFRHTNTQTNKSKGIITEHDDDEEEELESSFKVEQEISDDVDNLEQEVISTTRVLDTSERLAIREAENDAAHKELDAELLATNQKILNLVRKIDSMPSKSEIDQYQRRYIELHQQLCSKNRDLKKLYVLYNTLDSTKHYLTKENNLLNSIMDNLELTNDSAVNRSEFTTQLRDIISKIQSVRDDVLGRLEVLKQNCISLNNEYNDILKN